MTRIFSITPPSAAPFAILLAIGLLLILLLGFFTFIGYSAKNTRFEVSDRGLLIKGGIYGRFIPREEISRENIKIIDLNAPVEYRPGIRTNGIGLPGYSEGWFKLKNGEKALLFVTDRANVVYVPTRQDYSVLLSVSNPEEFYQSTKVWE